MVATREEERLLRVSAFLALAEAGARGGRVGEGHAGSRVAVRHTHLRTPGTRPSMQLYERAVVTCSPGRHPHPPLIDCHILHHLSPPPPSTVAPCPSSTPPTSPTAARTAPPRSAPRHPAASLPSPSPFSPHAQPRSPPSLTSLDRPLCVLLRSEAARSSSRTCEGRRLRPLLPRPLQTAHRQPPLHPPPSPHHP